MSTTTAAATAAQDLFQESHRAARQICKTWIRRVFSETSLQILRQQWKIQGDELEISIEMLLHCQRVCQRLAVHWETRLRQGEQNQVATWVKEVADTGEFWQQEEATTSSTDETNEKEQEEVAPATEEDTDPQEDEPFPDMKLPITKLRHLIKTNPNDLPAIQATLDQLSKSHQHNCWPLDWDSTVQEYCENQLVPRLHTKRTQRVQYEVVPKEVIEQEQIEEDTTTAANLDLLGSGRMKRLLERKRKAADTSLQPRQPEDPQEVKRRRKRLREEITPAERANARPPSDHPEQVIWDWQAIKKSLEHEHEHLEAMMIHSDMDPNPPNTLLGALRTMGETHFYLSPCNEDWTEKQQRRAQRATTKQRLAGTVLRSEKKAPMTKVVRTSTTGSNFDSSVDETTKQFHLELDVGECLLELNDGKLHAFSSLEISLLDEDADS